MDLMNVHEEFGFTWGTWRRDPTVSISMVGPKDRIEIALQMERGQTTGRWRADAGPCDEMWQPIPKPSAPICFECGRPVETSTFGVAMVDLHCPLHAEAS
jgi:hypothetical protein